MEAAAKQFKKRNAILSYLQSTKVHPSAEMVYVALKPEIPDLSLGTVYRNLAKFRRQGTAVSVGTVCGAERFDANTEPHAHFVCSACSAVLDLPQVQIPESVYSRAQEEMELTVDACRLCLTGLCAACSRKQKGGESA